MSLGGGLLFFRALESLKRDRSAPPRIMLQVRNEATHEALERAKSSHASSGILKSSKVGMKGSSVREMRTLERPKLHRASMMAKGSSWEGGPPKLRLRLVRMNHTRQPRPICKAWYALTM